MDGKLFEEATKSHVVNTFCSDRFTVGHRAHKSYLRLALSSPADTSELEKGLNIVKALMENKKKVLPL